MYTPKMNVLVVDDDPETLESMKLLLADFANVTVVSSGKQALQSVREHQTDVILLDIEMPVMDGFKTLGQLRNLKECINVPVIMLTGKRDKYSVMSSITMGVDGYLLKPISRNELIAKINEVCQKRQQQGNRKTILAIDDDMAYLKQLNSFLQDYYNVIMINSAKLALDYLTNHVPDLILLDYQMPLYNGVSMIHMIGQRDNCQDIPFIVLSGSLDQKALLDFYPHEPAAYLAKPVNKDILLEKIRLILFQSPKKEG